MLTSKFYPLKRGMKLESKLLLGKEVSASLTKELSSLISELKSLKITPKLAAILIGDNPASQIYVNSKAKFFAKNNCDSETFRFDLGASEQEVLKCIESLNQDDSVHGILVQLPLPKEFNDEKILSAISPQKDVDGFHGEGWNLDQRISRLEALKMFTIWPAIASFEEDIKGTIEVGKLADFSVFDQDLMHIPELKILESNNILTVVDGRVVYQN